MRSATRDSSETRLAAPPPVVDGMRVIAFAAVRGRVKYSALSGLVVIAPDGTSGEVGPVPRLAIGQSLRGKRQFYLLHCTRTWQVLAVQAGFASAKEAERRAELSYPGVRDAWYATDVTLREAKEFERVVWHRLKCSFCGRIPPEQETSRDRIVISAPSANICGSCVRAFNEQAKEADSEC
jgi:hypothetical protein